MSVTKFSSFIGYFLGAFCVLIWGITFVSTKALLSDFSALEILFYRFVMAYFALWIIRPKIMNVSAYENFLFALAGLSGVVVYQFAENSALSFTACSNVSIIVAVSPMLTAILSQLFLKERHINTFFVLGFVVSIVGVAMVSLNGVGSLDFNPKGDLIALFAAICWAGYSLCVSVINHKKYDSVCATRRIFFFAVLFMIPLAVCGSFADKQSIWYFNLSTDINALRFSKFVNIFNMIFLGVVASGLCFWAWNKACYSVGTVRITVGIYLIPVVTIFFAHIFLDEYLSLMGAIGAGITIVGLFISGIKKRSKN